MILAARGAAQDQRADLSATLDAVQRLPPSRWASEGLEQLDEALRSTPESHPDYPFALQFAAGIRLDADRFDEVRPLCERASRLNQEQVEAARRAGRGSDAELQARMYGVQILVQEARLWTTLGLTDRLSSTVAAERRQLDELRACGGSPVRFADAEWMVACDGCTLALAQERATFVLDDCARMRKLELGLDPAQDFALDLLEAQAQHDLALEKKFDSSRARASLEAVRHSQQSTGAQRYQALLLLSSLDLAGQDWDSARSRLRDLRDLEQGDEAALLPLELRAWQRAIEGRWALATHATREARIACRAALRSEWKAYLERWRSITPPASGLGILHWGSQRDCIATAIDLERGIDAGAEADARALEWVLETQSIGTLARRLGGEPVDVPAVQAALCGDGHGCALFLPSMERSHLALVTREHVHWFDLGSWDSLQASIASWQDDVLAAPEEGAAGAAPEQARLQRLADRGAAVRRALLPGPAIAEIASWSAVSFCGLGLLSHAPIEILPLEDGTPLGVRCAASELPSLVVGVLLARRAAVERRGVTLIGDPTLDEVASADRGGLDRLSIDPAQAAALCGGVTPARARILLGSDAWLSSDARAALGTSQLGIILGHGVHDDRLERPQAILLARGDRNTGLVTCDDLERLEATPPLVELLSCSSAKGRTRYGDDGDATLAAALFLRDTNCVLQVRSDVLLGTTLSFARQVNELILREGRAPAEAVRATRERVWRDPATRAPFFWGSFTLTGLGSRALAQREHAPEARPGSDTAADPVRGRVSWLGLLALVLGALLLAVAWRMRRRRDSH